MKWYETDNGYGYGYGNGNGYGNNSGRWYGLGYGLGDGLGNGSGVGHGYGCGYGIGVGYGCGYGTGFGTGEGESLLSIELTETGLKIGCKTHSIDEWLGDEGKKVLNDHPEAEPIAPFIQAILEGIQASTQSKRS